MNRHDFFKAVFVLLAATGCGGTTTLTPQKPVVEQAQTWNYQGTVPAAINDAGIVAGWWRDPNYLAHGFVRYP